jgi:hypothetical protein
MWHEVHTDFNETLKLTSSGYMNALWRASSDLPYAFTLTSPKGFVAHSVENTASNGYYSGVSSVKAKSDSRQGSQKWVADNSSCNSKYRFVGAV